MPAAGGCCCGCATGDAVSDATSANDAAIVRVRTRGIVIICAPVRAGEAGATERLAERVYGELRRMARGQVARERGSADSLVPTALVHEAWVRLAGAPLGDFAGRGHFFAACATAMRRILVERARRRRRLRHGGALLRVELDDEVLASLPAGSDLIDLDSALARLALEAPRPARLVELRVFGGLGQAEAAEAVGVSRATADRRRSGRRD